ncbi:MAG: Stp1/IreP family PP2C-type Ser/Thr phosphatase [Zhaonellaceae bacterium]|jgi:serine/threonine protein phosphatase PrpC|nr:Stp1/IreP family PP2C-type Ser/Thr phosphatase [Clostridia bacterium]
MRAVARSETGLVRKTNEDSFLCDKERGLFIVADGMGGHLAGEVASKLAIEAVANHLQLDGSDPLLKLKDAVEYANQVIYNNSQGDRNHKGMGTTLTLALFADGKLYIAHVGDSRVYLIRNQEITLLTQDHSYVGELVRSGGITEEQALTHPQRNVLLRAVGTSPTIDIDLLEVNLLPNDLILLCTDGLTNHISEDKILELILATQDLNQALDKMMELAYNKGANDNVTILLTQY